MLFRSCEWVACRDYHDMSSRIACVDQLGMLTSTSLTSYFAIHGPGSDRWMDFHMTFEVRNPVRVRKEFPPKNDWILGELVKRFVK